MLLSIYISKVAVPALNCLACDKRWSFQPLGFLANALCIAVWHYRYHNRRMTLYTAQSRAMKSNACKYCLASLSLRFSLSCSSPVGKRVLDILHTVVPITFREVCLTRKCYTRPHSLCSYKDAMYVLLSLSVHETQDNLPLRTRCHEKKALSLKRTIIDLLVHLPYVISFRSADVHGTSQDVCSK